MKEQDEALFPMPARSAEPLRAAVQRLDPAEAVRFEQEFHAAWETALLEDSTVPMKTFLYRWGVFVALHRIPSRSARLRELEREVGSASSLEEARIAGKEIEELLEVAAREAASA
ncbi:hypothetical protein [Streptomyces sp. NPDC007100]|uniref:hypothetical protein n=1 Tax=Streptomyces sp. NPDC007100 TaxID=3155602 RepID=UPI0033CADE78